MHERERERGRERERERERERDRVHRRFRQRSSTPAAILYCVGNLAKFKLILSQLTAGPIFGGGGEAELCS